MNPVEQDNIEGDEEIDIEYPYIVGDFSLKGYSTIKMEIETPISASMILNLEVFNDDEESLALEHYNNGELTEIEVSAGSSEVIFTSDEYNINELISIFPTRVEYSIEPIVGVEGEQITYSAGDEIVADITIQAELDLDADCFLIPKNESGEPSMEKVDTEAIDQEQIDSYIDGKIILNYHNSMGFSAGADLLISEIKTTNFEELLIADSTLYTIINIPMLEECSDTLNKQIELQLDQSDLQIMLADSVFVVPKIKISSDAGTPISGGLKLQGTLEIEVKISNDLVEGE